MTSRLAWLVVMVLGLVKSQDTITVALDYLFLRGV